MARKAREGPGHLSREQKWTQRGRGWGCAGAALMYWKKLYVDEGGNMFHVVSEFRDRAVCLVGYSQNLD